MVDGKARNMGLGSYPKVSVAKALLLMHRLRREFWDPVDCWQKIRKWRDDLTVEQYVAVQRFFDRRL
jgi:hypothetical protein